MARTAVAKGKLRMSHIADQRRLSPPAHHPCKRPSPLRYETTDAVEALLLPMPMVDHRAAGLPRTVVAAPRPNCDACAASIYSPSMVWVGPDPPPFGTQTLDDMPIAHIAIGRPIVAVYTKAQVERPPWERSDEFLCIGELRHVVPGDAGQLPRVVMEVLRPARCLSGERQPQLARVALPLVQVMCTASVSLILAWFS